MLGFDYKFTDYIFRKTLDLSNGYLASTSPFSDLGEAAERSEGEDGADHLILLPMILMLMP